MNKKNKFFIGLLGNIFYDSRSLNLYKSLEDNGLLVSATGFEWRSKINSFKNNGIKIYTLSKSCLSFWFYTKFAIILLFNAFKSKANIFFAEDIYSLPFLYFAAKLVNAKIYYDSRELYGFLAGLKDKQFIQRLLQKIEFYFISKVDCVIVTGDMDAEFLHEKYLLKDIIVLRNLPKFYKPKTRNLLRKKFNIPKEKKILIYQGVILHGRGIKLLLETLKISDNYILVLLGDGEHLEYYQNYAAELSVVNKVIFAGKIEQHELLDFTVSADVGLALIENISLSYYYALPNKLFEYIMAEVPVVVSNMPQMKELVNKYNIGFVLEDETPESLKKILDKLFSDEKLYCKIKANQAAASIQLNWDIEVNHLLDRIKNM